MTYTAGQKHMIQRLLGKGSDDYFKGTSSTKTNERVEKALAEYNLHNIPKGYVVVASAPSYIINRDGVIKRLVDNKIVTPYKVDSGYVKVELKVGDKWVDKFLHVLQAEAFLKNPKKLKVVNHKDGDKSNHSLSNLEWVSVKGNSDHAIGTGLTDPNGVKNGMSKLKSSDVVSIFKSQLPTSTLAKRFKVSVSTIKSIRSGKAWKKLLSSKGLI